MLEFKVQQRDREYMSLTRVRKTATNVVIQKTESLSWLQLLVQNSSAYLNVQHVSHLAVADRLLALSLIRKYLAINNTHMKYLDKETISFTHILGADSAQARMQRVVDCVVQTLFSNTYLHNFSSN
jgi:hypothetical protein